MSLLWRSAFPLGILVFSAAILPAACSDSDEVEPTGSTGAGASNTGGMGNAGGDGGGGDGGNPAVRDCDSIVPEVCGLPFPNDAFTVEDDATPTGLRLNLTAATLPTASNENTTDPAPFNARDGFSTGAVLLAFLPGATEAGLNNHDTIADSLDDGFPTVLIDVETGERIAHYTQLDRVEPEDDARALMIQPAITLKENTRYIVAVRDIVDGDGRTLAPSAAFTSLRDGGEYDGDDAVDLESRRAHFEEIFEALDSAGIAKDNLQLAWDFTTASVESNTDWMVHMRDEALASVGANGPSYTIDNVDTDYETASIAFRITGTMQVPNYLDQFDPGASLIFGDDGLPEPNPDMETMDAEWELLIPQSALTTPARLVQYGHGLLGSKTQIESGHFLTFMNTFNYAFFSVDFIGMASDDEEWIGNVLVDGRLEELQKLFMRQHQGMLNSLLAMRMMTTGFSDDATYGTYIDPVDPVYYGISQGGIFGGTYMALSTDVEKGALGVFGQAYNLLLTRSVDFDVFQALLASVYPDSRDRLLALSAIQQLWDRTEPAGYTQHLTSDTLENTSAKKVLLRAVIGDHQVTTQGAHAMARAMNASQLDNGLRDIWGLTKQASPTTNAVYVEYDLGVPAEPLCNVPNRLCSDPHGEIRKIPEVRDQLDHFFRTGDVINTCPGGVCSFAGLSGCVGGEELIDQCPLGSTP